MSVACCSWLSSASKRTRPAKAPPANVAFRSAHSRTPCDNFTGVATSAVDANGRPVTGTGYDLADLLLDYPQSSSIQYSGLSDYFRQNQFNAYVQDEWKARPNLTLTLGVRYEYFSPIFEKYDRMANLDIAPGFTSVAVVTPNTTGPYSGTFPSGLIYPDYNNFSPRPFLDSMTKK